MQYKGGKSSAADMAIRRQRLLETGFLHFARVGIEDGGMKEIAREAGVGIATLFRYYPSKLDFVIAIGMWKWDQVFQDVFDQLRDMDVTSLTSAQRYELFLNTFIVLYQNNRMLLRFNQFFNIYLQEERRDPSVLHPYLTMIDSISDRFAENVGSLVSDGTMRQDIPARKIFVTSLHLMLAVATRFAVGLVYQPVSAMKPEEELLLLKQMLLTTFTTQEPA